MLQLETEPQQRRRLGTVRTVIVGFFAVVGMLSTALFAVGLFTDYRSFDQTSGGYTAPYTDFVGTPIDFTAGATTDEGFRMPGRVADTLLNCTTGMISFEVYGVRIDFRTLSERALAVHKPIEACERIGFTPDFVPTPGA